MMFKITISMDLLPFAQKKRWRGASGVDRVLILSDHNDPSFGTAYGVFIKELLLLVWVVFWVAREGIVQYIQVADEVSKEPVYKEINKIK